MFNEQLCAELRRHLPDFALEQPCNPAGSALTEAAQVYLEFYGFLEVLKDSEVDYFWGYRTCPCRDKKMRIATHYWRLPEARGTVFILHGLFDHVGLFQDLVAYLLAQQFSVIAIDLPGHGLSDGEATVVTSFFDYAAVLEDTYKFFRWQLPDVPVYAIGQSTGASVLMAFCFSSAAAGESQPFSRLVFLAPLMRPRQWPWGRLAYRWLGGWLRRLRRDFSFPNSHDAEFHSFLRYSDPLQAKWLSIDWVGALNEWVEGFAARPEVATPSLIVQGTADRVVDWRHNVPAIQSHFPNNQVNYIKGAMHHLANEADAWRKPVFTGVGQFLRQRGAQRGEV
jgi:alpha-beta hydrolase superfamily lysophospholipase